MIIVLHTLYLIFISHVLYVNEILYFKDVVNCISKNVFCVAAWRWLYKRAENCRQYDLLIIFWIYLIQYILCYTENLYTFYYCYWKHNGDTSTEIYVFNLRTIWKCQVSFALRPLDCLGNSCKLDFPHI